MLLTKCKITSRKKPTVLVNHACENKALTHCFYVINSRNGSSACFRDYAAIVFFANNRFETGKRKLQYLTFQDFAFCAGQLISSWTVGAVGELFI